MPWLLLFVRDVYVLGFFLFLDVTSPAVFALLQTDLRMFMGATPSQVFVFGLKRSTEFRQLVPSLPPATYSMPSSTATPALLRRLSMLAMAVHVLLCVSKWDAKNYRRVCTAALADVICFRLEDSVKLKQPTFLRINLWAVYLRVVFLHRCQMWGAVVASHRIQAAVWRENRE